MIKMVFENLCLLVLWMNVASALEELEMTETLAYGYSPESTQREFSNEYQHDMVSMVFKSLCILELWTKVASALEGLKVMSAKAASSHLMQALNPLMPGAAKKVLTNLVASS